MERKPFMKLNRYHTVAIVMLLGVLADRNWPLPAQTTAPKSAVIAPPGTHFDMDVVESFDAKYEGDTPGHTGRAGGLNDIRPNIALGDGVFHGDERIGTITNIAWSRAQGSLAIEFDPAPGRRVAVGDHFWIDLNPTPTK